jgi:hypothetical protein
MARSRNPLVPLDLFRSRNFNVVNLSTVLIYGSIYVTFQFFALFAIGVLGYNEVGYGLTVIPTDLFLALFSARFGTLADRHGPRIFMTVGPALMGVALLWFVRIPADSAPWRFELGDSSSLLPPASFWVDVFPALVIFGIGLMVMVAPLTTALMRSVPVRHSGVASAFNNAVSRVGPQLAGALLFILVTSTFYATLGDALPGSEETRVRDIVSPLNPVPEDTDEEVAAAATTASTDAFRLTMLVAALMCLAGAAINAVGIRNPARDPERHPREPVTPCPQAPPLESPARTRG